jgi:hypothetical protein
MNSGIVDHGHRNRMKTAIPFLPHTPKKKFSLSYLANTQIVKTVPTKSRQLLFFGS